MRGGFTNIYTYLWLVVDARQPGILDGPNSLPKHPERPQDGKFDSAAILESGGPGNE